MAMATHAAYTAMALRLKIELGHSATSASVRHSVWKRKMRSFSCAGPVVIVLRGRPRPLGRPWARQFFFIFFYRGVVPTLTSSCTGRAAALTVYQCRRLSLTLVGRGGGDHHAPRAATTAARQSATMCATSVPPARAWQVAGRQAASARLHAATCSFGR